MTSCNGRRKKVRQQGKNAGKIMGKSMQRQKNNWKNRLGKSYILCINYIENEPWRPVTVKRLQLRKLVVTVMIA